MTDMTKGATPAHPSHGGVDPARAWYLPIEKPPEECLPPTMVFFPFDNPGGGGCAINALGPAVRMPAPAPPKGRVWVEVSGLDASHLPDYVVSRDRLNPTDTRRHDALAVHRAAPKPPTVDIDLGPVETAADLCKRLGDDGAKWAAEFRKTARRLGYSDMDEGWLIGWFANVIECSGDVRRWRAEKEAPAADETKDANYRAWAAAAVAPLTPHGKKLAAVEHDFAEAWSAMEATPGPVNEDRWTRAKAALRAARAPKDPVAELREAWADFRDPETTTSEAIARLERAIATIAGEKS
jgi:hypothetical protein